MRNLELSVATERSSFAPGKGTLYVVSTPIGNLEDISLRALATLRSVSLVAAESRGVIAHLLARYNIDVETMSLRERAGSDSLAAAASALETGKDVALVCDAGTPLIADPGTRLVKAAIRMKCSVVSVPGAVAAIAALTVSGLNTQRFVFDGFPPRSRSDRSIFFSGLAAESRTIVLYESRSHLRNTLGCLMATLGASRQIAVTRNLTRAGETTYRGSIADVLARIGSNPPKGEYVIVIGSLTDN